MFKHELNKIRYSILQSCFKIKEGHIGSAFSVIEILYVIFKRYFKKHYFILSKGHAAIGVYAVMNHFKILNNKDYKSFCKLNSRLGGHPDSTKIPGVEASTGSLGHGFPTAIGVALGLKIKKKSNRIFALLGDGECHEGTIWESANIGANQQLGNLCAIVDWNQSAAQLMPVDDLPGKWESFGWEISVIDGHSQSELESFFSNLDFDIHSKPKVLLAKNIKGKGVSIIEGHGAWHHKIPNDEEFEIIKKELSF